MRRPATAAGFASPPDPDCSQATWVGQYPDLVAETRMMPEIGEVPPRCVLVLDPDSPRWLIANAAAVLGASAGAAGAAALGPDLTDASGGRWAGIAEIVVPVLAAPPAELAALRAAAQDAGVT